MTKDKIKTIDEVAMIAQELRDEGKTVVTTNGTFDILHSGHINLLEKAKKEGDVLVVLFNSDDSVKRNRGEKRPILSEKERARILAGLGCVDYVVVFPQDKPLEYLDKIRGHIHVKGGSWDPERMSEEKDFVEKWGGEYKTFELEPGLSTTKIIETILKGYREAD